MVRKNLRRAEAVDFLSDPQPGFEPRVFQDGPRDGRRSEEQKRQRAAGVQLIVAQGTEAGGHTGDIATMVLVPQVVQAVGEDVAVLAAGGIARGSQIAASLALGAQGVWCGTVWLGTRESELDPFEKSVLFEASADDAVRRIVSLAELGAPGQSVTSLEEQVRSTGLTTAHDNRSRYPSTPLLNVEVIVLVNINSSPRTGTVLVNRDNAESKLTVKVLLP